MHILKGKKRKLTRQWSRQDENFVINCLSLHPLGGSRGPARLRTRGKHQWIWVGATVKKNAENIFSHRLAEVVTVMIAGCVDWEDEKRDRLRLPDM